jgi:hypothetical protein
MKHYKTWNDLREHGIDYLTGESCAYGYRGLCDLTRRGIQLVAATMGITDVTRFTESLPEAWNSKGVRSIMLAHQLLTPLAVFACWESGCSKAYIMYDDSVVGIEASDNPEDVQRWLEWNQGKYCQECRRYGAGGGVALQYSNPGFSRNQHQMSGRTT